MGTNEHGFIRNIGVMSGGLAGTATNSPKEYRGRKRQYLSGETGAFAAKYAKYAGDYFDAECQGLDPDDFYAWKTITMRMTDVVRPSAAITRTTDDWKMVLADSAKIDYIPMGAKIKAAGSTWLMINPSNISSAYGTGIMRRCNATWNHLDFYGNILQEPIIISNSQANANTPDTQDYMLITTGYFNLVMQKNEWTRQLKQNSRIILGDWAFTITGPGDFLEEFTGDVDSEHLSRFAARFEVPNDAIDDMETHVAGGKTFEWEIQIDGAPATVETGANIALTAISKRNGETVTSTDEYPIYYLWESSDAAVADVDAFGAVTAYSAGTCEITCTLAQNPAVSATMALTVIEASAEDSVRFIGAIPESLGMLEGAKISAAYFTGGVQSSEEIAWEFSGAAKGSYKALRGDNAVYITCYGASDTPLKIKAIYGENSTETSIRMEGI